MADVAAANPSSDLLSGAYGAAASSNGVDAKVATGAYHSCAVNAVGGLKCWGRNNYGQVGDLSLTNRSLPQDVVGLTSGVKEVVAGRYHSCALTTSGAVRCWGLNANGQLGVSMDRDYSAIPLAVTGLSSGVVALTAGAWHTCAVLADASAQCWGNNGDGQLGDGTTTSRAEPRAVFGLTSGVAMISGGTYHTCAVDNNGAAWCWGSNNSNQLGDNNPADGHRPRPAPVFGLGSGVQAIAAGGQHSCAVMTSGAVECWGFNGDGQLGDDSTTARSTATSVTNFNSEGASIDAGGTSTCALTTSSALRCWGNNGYGQLGDGTRADRHTFVTPLTNDVTHFSTSTNEFFYSSDPAHTCAVKNDGSLSCWGSGSYGQIGIGTYDSSSSPQNVATFGQITNPSPFGFSTRTDVAFNVYVQSEEITPTGFFGPTYIAVENGEYSIGCTGTFTRDYGTFVPGLSVCLRNIVPPNNIGTTTATTSLIIGGVIGRFTISTETAPTLTTAAELPSGSQNISYSKTLSVSGGSGNFRFSQVEGTLPLGLSLSTSGVISGVPTEFGAFGFTVRVTDNSTALTDSKTFSLRIAQINPMSTGIGLYNPTRSMFYLRNSATTGAADTTFLYGPGGRGWIPLVGDWDGDGQETI
ncbi:hypothetical protein U5801_27265, partial [Lamprobacter modestohalophilus]|nr:hypothetical protein [Lamprobacter modestohalophilus]